MFSCFRGSKCDTRKKNLEARLHTLNFSNYGRNVALNHNVPMNVGKKIQNRHVQNLRNLINRLNPGTPNFNKNYAAANRRLTNARSNIAREIKNTNAAKKAKAKKNENNRVNYEFGRRGLYK